MSNSRFAALGWFFAGLVIGAFGAGTTTALLALNAVSSNMQLWPSTPRFEPAGIRGVLHVSGFARPGDDKAEFSTEPLRHVSRLIRGPDFQSMEDNDIRGFLDGRVAYRVNQATQIHVRLGRGFWPSRYGEHELLRVLQRWDRVRLPPGVRIKESTLIVGVEQGPRGDLDVMLYAVNKDWDPGQGGVLRDNSSRPLRGSVGWTEMEFEQRTWGLPGVGFASNSHAMADTDETALAVTHYSFPAGLPHRAVRWLRRTLADQSAENYGQLEFRSPAFTNYVQKRVEQNQPILLLLKLADWQEDRLKNHLALYSANHGDEMNTARRPQLSLEWTSPKEVVAHKREILLEYGRTVKLPIFDVSNAGSLAVSFYAESGYETPIVEIRGGIGNEVTPWQKFTQPIQINWEWAEIKLLAARNPIVLGDEFRSAFRDTWVQTAPPENQIVKWTFLSPSGREFIKHAEYKKDFRWVVSFKPDELGRWHYYWSQDFLDQRYHSPIGVFDIVSGDRQNARKQLNALLDRIKNSKLNTAEERRMAFETQFLKLERAAMQLETADTIRSPSGRELIELIGNLRTLMSTEALPEPEQLPLFEY